MVAESSDTHTPDPTRGRKGSSLALIASDLSGRNFSEEGRRQAMADFLEGFVLTGTIRGGCLRAHVSRETVRYWLDHSDEFARRFEDAKEDYNDALRAAIHYRAVEGVEKVRRAYYKGQIIDEIVEREYSDSLLLAQAKAKMPEYRDKDRGAGQAQIPLESILDLIREIPDDAKPSVAATSSSPTTAQPFDTPGDAIEGEWALISESSDQSDEPKEAEATGGPS